MLNATKPLTLSYQVPAGPAGKWGPDCISLTIPPLALLKLCKAILSADDNNANKESNMEAIRIVKALQCFFLETFQIHVEKLELTKYRAQPLS